MSDIEEQFKYFLQRHIIFSIDGKIIKEGKLMLFNKKDYYLILYIKNNNQEQKKYEIPYPFSSRMDNNRLVLDYKLESISNKDVELYYRLASLNQTTNSKFFNTTVSVFEKNALDLKVVS
jgi:hypothetical protein